MPTEVFDSAFSMVCTAKDALRKNILVEKKDTIRAIFDHTETIAGAIGGIFKGIDEFSNKGLSKVKDIASNFKSGTTRTTAKSLLKMAERGEVGRVIRDANKLSPSLPKAANKSLLDAVRNVEGAKILKDTLSRSPLIAGTVKFIGKVAVPLSIAEKIISVNDIAISNRPGEATVGYAGKLGGTWAGAKGGALIGAKGGALIGFFFGGPPGAAIGGVVVGVVGGAVGGIAGSAIGEYIGKIAYKNSGSAQKKIDKVGEFTKDKLNQVKDTASNTFDGLKNLFK